MTWTKNNNRLEKEFEFENFSRALGFVNQCGEIFEKLNHHPDISIIKYKFVHISTTTHDAGNTLTELDYIMTQKIDELV